MILCRASNCGMKFAADIQRLQHENLMHKDFIKEAAIVLVNKINQNNSEEALNKKVLKTNIRKFSYKEVKELINQDNQFGREILNIMMKTVNTYFAYNPNHTVKELLNVSNFIIK